MGGTFAGSGPTTSQIVSEGFTQITQSLLSIGVDIITPLKRGGNGGLMELPTSSRMPSMDVAALAANRDPRAHCPGLCAVSAFGTPQCPMHLNLDGAACPHRWMGMSLPSHQDVDLDSYTVSFCSPGCNTSSGILFP